VDNDGALCNQARRQGQFQRQVQHSGPLSTQMRNVMKVTKNLVFSIHRSKKKTALSISKSGLYLAIVAFLNFKNLYNTNTAKN
jgi:hypothetical protein